MSDGRYLVRVLLIAAALSLCVGGPGPAHAGGTPIGFVSLPARGTQPPIGIVTPRYAFVLEKARGTVAVLDLAHGRIASRIAVGVQPEQIAVDGTTLWIAHAESGMLTRVDVTTPAKPRLLARLDNDGKLAALVADPELHSVFVAFRHSGVVARYVDAGARATAGYRTRVARIPLAGLAVVLPQLLIAADRHGVLHLMREQNGRRLSELRRLLAAGAGSPEAVARDDVPGLVVGHEVNMGGLIRRG